MKEYSLSLIGSFTPWRTYSSMEFFGNELRRRFEKLPHVDLRVQCFNDVDYDAADFALIHAYFSTNVYANIASLKSKVRKVAAFTEEPHRDVDYNWYFSDAACDFPYRGHMVFPPISRDTLRNEAKEPNSILLDHDIVEFWYYRHPDLDWNQRIWAAMEELRDTHKIYQIQRHDSDQTPGWITKIPHGTPEEYLRATERMETFVVTHHGSYNHTAVEMIARGTRTLVPTPPGKLSFVPRTNIRMFQLPTFEDERQLVDLIRQPIDVPFWDKQIDKCIDMDGVVAQMDHMFLNWMDYLKAKQSGHPLPLNFSWL